MSLASRVAAIAASIPSVHSETAVFVRMDGAYAVVNVGPNTIRAANVGWVPPATGMVVQLEWRNGTPTVTGPAVALNPIGTITGTGTPRATVTVDGVEYLLYIRDGYAPVIDDLVTVNWQTGIIEGKISGQESTVPPNELPPAASMFTDLVVRAANSGRHQSAWWGNDPWASNSNDGIWVYQSRVRDALRGASISAVRIYLPLQSQLGNCSIGLHSHANIPAGAPVITNLVPLPLGGRSGWVTLPTEWGALLRDYDGGIGVTAPGGGKTVWSGTATDPLSGALGFNGTR